MRYSIFGGSFDPPHLSHTLAMLWALESGEIDHVLMIPVGAHAFGKQAGASFEHRLAMCRLAARNIASHVTISDIEGRRPGISFMIETLEALAEELPGARFRLITGSDVAAQVGQWRRGSEVLERAPLLEVPRPAAGESSGQRPGALPMISSTQVREALRLGEEPRSLVGAAVLGYIREEGLYGRGDSGR